MTDELQQGAGESAQPGAAPAPKTPRKKSAQERQQQVDQAQQRLAASSQGANANPITLDETYSGLREENRVVMRHTIALNIDSFRAAPENFAARPPPAATPRCRRWPRPSSR